MANLVPEKRLDRNGNLVTKHVRATPKQPSQRTAIPSPTSGGAPTSTKSAYKPKPRQTEQAHRGYRLAHFASSLPLTSGDDRAVNRYGDSYSDFRASDVEVYEVLSATSSQGDALELMARGIRTAKDARSYLKRHKAEHLIADRSTLMQSALERGISADTFVEGYNMLTPKQREAPNVLDGVEFKVSPLNNGYNASLLPDILSGDVTYSDLKAIGITRLKPHARARSLTKVLAKLNRGEADYTLDDVKAFVVRAADAKTNDTDFRVAAEFGLWKGFDLLQDKKDFDLMKQAHYQYLSTAVGFRYEGDAAENLTADRIEYDVRFRKRLNSPVHHSGYSDQFFDEGIPPEVAADVVAGGGGLHEALAVHNEGIESNLSSGWL